MDKVKINGQIFLKFKNSNVNANISITAEKFLKQKSFSKDFKIKKDGLID